MKHCNKCSGDKAESDFYKNRNICKACDAANNRAWRLINKDRACLVAQKWRGENKDRLKLVSSEYKKENRQQISERQAAFRKENQDRLRKRRNELRLLNVEKAREQMRAYGKTEKGKARQKAHRVKHRDLLTKRMRDYQRNNRHIYTANQGIRRARKIQATPVWANQKQIKTIYKIAGRLRELGRNVHVDHIVPLKSDLVCGLHVEWNLQIISAFENMSKHNRITDWAKA